MLIVFVEGSNALDVYEPGKVEKALRMLLVHRNNEFHEIARGIGYPTTIRGWELVVLNFCLDFDTCFYSWSGKRNDSDHNQIHKCMTMMRQMTLGKSNMVEITHMENTAYKIAEDFKSIIARIE